jgi:hypothetical protein
MTDVVALFFEALSKPKNSIVTELLSNTSDMSVLRFDKGDETLYN